MHTVHFFFILPMLIVSGCLFVSETTTVSSLSSSSGISSQEHSSESNTMSSSHEEDESSDDGTLSASSVSQAQPYRFTELGEIGEARMSAIDAYVVLEEELLNDSSCTTPHCVSADNTYLEAAADLREIVNNASFSDSIVKIYEYKYERESGDTFLIYTSYKKKPGFQSYHSQIMKVDNGDLIITTKWTHCDHYYSGSSETLTGTWTYRESKTTNNDLYGCEMYDYPKRFYYPITHFKTVLWDGSITLTDTVMTEREVTYYNCYYDDFRFTLTNYTYDAQDWRDPESRITNRVDCTTWDQHIGGVDIRNTVEIDDTKLIHNTLYEKDGESCLEKDTTILHRVTRYTSNPQETNPEPPCSSIRP